MKNSPGKHPDRIESLNHFFKQLAGFTYDHRWLMSLLCLLILSVCGYFASFVRFDNSFESFFDKNDLVYKRFLEFRDDFGSDEISYILYDAPAKKHGVWDIGVMKTIQSLTRELETQVPFVKRVVSLANVQFMEGKDDTLYIHELLKPFPENQDKLLVIRDKILAKPVYVDGLTSRDGAFGAIILEMEKSSIDPVSDIMVDPVKGNQISNLFPQATCAAIDNILKRHGQSGIRFYHSGDVPLNSAYNIITQRESTLFGVLSFVVIGLLLLVFLRNLVGVIGPLCVVFCALLMTVGFMGMLGWQFDFMFIILPTILVAVGVADAVHIVSGFQTHYTSLNNRREAIKQTAYFTGVPCLFTSVTTVAGFTSMSISPIKAIKHFAIYSSIGVACAFVLSMTVLIVFVSFGSKASLRAQQKVSKAPARMASFLSWVADVNIRHKHMIIAFFAILFVFSGLGISRITVDSNLLSEFSDRVEIKRATEYVDSVMGGSISYSYIFDTGEQGGIMAPEVLKAIELLQQKAEDDEIVLKTYSIVDLIKDINRSINNEDQAFYKLPDSRELTADYFFLYDLAGGDELDNYVTLDYSRANLEIRTAFVDSSRAKKLIETLDSTVRSMGLSISTPSVTGMGALWYQLVDYIVKSQLTGFSLAFAVITIFLCILFRSVKVGLLAMIPNLAPVVITLGMMGWAGIPLDYIKLLIGCIAIGLAVDDTIHLVNHYRYAFTRTGDYKKALCESMDHVGKAVLITSVVLFCGFLVLTFSVMASMVQFAILIAITILVALAADLFLLPSLFLVLKPLGMEQATKLQRLQCEVHFS